MNRFKLLQQFESATSRDDKKRVLKKLCNDCTGLEIDLEKYEKSFGQRKVQEKKKEEEEDIDLDLALVRLKAVDILNIKVLWLAVERRTTTVEALKKMCYDSFGFPMSCQILFRGEGPLGDYELLDEGGACANEPYLSFDLYLSKNSLGKSGGDVIEEFPTLSEREGSIVSEFSLPVSVTAKSDAMDWTCPVCTYINLSWRPGCEMCNSTKPSS